jgi:DNA-binding response OmpR family regulator
MNDATTPATILVVEDDNQFRSFLEEYLELSGYTVISANNGRVGHELYRSRRPDILLTDISMPEKDGLELIREIKREFPKARIIAISGDFKGFSDIFLEVASLFRADAMLRKPFEMHVLKAEIERLMNPNSPAPAPAA